MRRCIMPSHRRPNYGNEKLLKKHPRGAEGAGVLHNSRQNANKRGSNAHGGIDANIEERVFPGTWQVKG